MASGDVESGGSMSRSEETHMLLILLDLCYLFRAIKLCPQQRYWIPIIHHVLVVWQLSRSSESRLKSGNRVKLGLALIQTRLRSCREMPYPAMCSLEERRKVKLAGQSRGRTSGREQRGK